MKRLVIGITLVLLVISILLAGITLIGIAPLLIFQSPLERAISKLIDSLLE